MYHKVAILAIVFSLTFSLIIPAFAQVPNVVILGNALQGTNSANPSEISTTGFLKWKQIFQDGTEEGSTEPMATLFRQLTFVPTDQPLRTLLEAQVIGTLDVSGVGANKCYKGNAWNLQQQVFLNGREFNIPKAIILLDAFDANLDGFPDDLDDLEYEQTGLSFKPNLIKRLFEFQGVTLQTGDKIVWKVDGNYRFEIFSGQVAKDLTRDFTKCVGLSSSEIEGFGFGFTTQMTFTWVDPSVLIARPATTEPDLDGDGIPDSVDQCDFIPERFNGFEDTDGCPDDDPIGFDVSTITDQDGDGIDDLLDTCPTQPEIFNGIDDLDGCPDGATIENIFVSIDEPLVSLTQATRELEELISAEQLSGIITTAEQEILQQTQATSTDEIELEEESPQTPVHTNQEPIVIQGISEECNPIIQNCNQVIGDAVRTFERQTGIQLPFEPSILNIIIILAVITGVIFIVLKRLRKI